MQPLHGCEDAFNHVFPLDAYAFINAALFLRPIGKGSGLIRHLKANTPNRFNILAIVHLAELAADIAAAGHEIGNHGYSHTSPNASSQEEITDEIQRTEQSIKAATGVTTTLYAPPSGECEAHVLEAADNLGYDTILWSVDTIDWQKPDAATIIERVESKIHGGAIILAHPTASTVEALPTIIDDLKEEGYNFVTVSSNLGL